MTDKIGDIVKAEKILNIVSIVSQFSIKDIKSKNRKKEIVEARRVYANIVNQKTKLSSIYIGNTLNRDHATMLHYYKDHEHNMKYYEEYRSMFETSLGLYNCDPEVERLKDTSVSQIILENENLKTELALKNNQIKQLSNNY